MQRYSVPHPALPGAYIYGLGWHLRLYVYCRVSSPDAAPAHTTPTHPMPAVLFDPGLLNSRATYMYVRLRKCL